MDEKQNKQASGKEKEKRENEGRGEERGKTMQRVNVGKKRMDGKDERQHARSERGTVESESKSEKEKEGKE